MSELLKRRPRLGYPFTILTDKSTVRLVAGEDYRYTLTAPDLERWLPAFLSRLVGKETLDAILAPLSAEHREAALQIVGQLYGERALIDGTAFDAHVARKYDIVVEGKGPLRDLLAQISGEPSRVSGRVSSGPSESPPAPPRTRLALLCQDRLDYQEALACNRRCRAAGTPFLWASYGAMSRAYVSPLFLPDAGPCFSCLLRSFERLSPAPEIYDALRDHARQGKEMTPVEFPEAGLLILQGLIRWKLTEAERVDSGPALYRLHVLEREHFEVTTHRVFRDLFCPECGTLT